MPAVRAGFSSRPAVRGCCEVSGLRRTPSPEGRAPSPRPGRPCCAHTPLRMSTGRQPRTDRPSEGPSRPLAAGEEGGRWRKASRSRGRVWCRPWAPTCPPCASRALGALRAPGPPTPRPRPLTLARRCAEPGAFARGRSLSVKGVCFLFASFTYSLFLNPRKCRVIRCSNVAIVAGSGLGDDVAVLCDSVTLRVGVNVSYSGIRAPWQSGWLTCPRAHSQ